MTILQLCLHENSNFGDAIGREVLSHALLRMGVDTDIEPVDIFQLHSRGENLDDRLDEINSKYDAVVLGSGGLLANHVLKWIFKSTDSWARIKIPLILFGVGVISNSGKANIYGEITANDRSNHNVVALQAASIVAVRDNRSYLFANRVLSSSKRIFLTGCPSMQFVRRPEGTEDTLLLNLPLRHGPAKTKVKVLEAIGRHLSASTPRLIWLCHSQSEIDDAERVINGYEQRVKIVSPKNLQDVSEIFADVYQSVVFKAHPGIFALANTIPTSFIAYDMKCMGLLEMFYDDPSRLAISIDKLTLENAISEVNRLLIEMSDFGPNIRKSQGNLRDFMDLQYRAFESAFRNSIQ